jgi:crotonobetainyl-CoA:carnitine CoA-transferase CaiB-like acyl-CoA transferase
VRLDWELARRGYRRYAAYPWATAAGLFTNVFFGLLIASILAFYGARVIRTEGPRQWLAFWRDEASAAELIAAVARDTRLLDVAIEETEIEEIVRRIYAAGAR